MILIGLGANMSGPWGAPRETVLRALTALDQWPLRLLRASRVITTAPFGPSNQPPYVNGVALIATHLPPDALLRRLHAIERCAGRARGIVWGPRTLDLDLLDYHGQIRNRHHAKARGKRPLILPHPGIAERIFVLLPIAEVAPRWRHPLTHHNARTLLRHLHGARAGAEV